MLLDCLIIFTCVCQCFSEDRRVITSLNYSNHVMKLAIVNGSPVDVQDVPHLVSIKEPLAKRKENKKIWGNLCGASIISSDGKLLTAAHCFEANNFLFAKRPYILRAVTGSPNTDIESVGISGRSKSGVQWRQISKALLHGDFVFPYNDIAIAFVDYPWDYKQGVKPIALPLTSTKATDLWDCLTAGYGRTGHGPDDKTSSILMIAHIEIMHPQTCSILWQMSMDSFICTVSLVTDVSEGDSGGPLWCDGKREPELVGIVSGKAFDKSTLYTRVSFYLDWIYNDKKTQFSVSKGSTKLFNYDTFSFIIIIQNFLVQVLNHHLMGTFSL